MCNCNTCIELYTTSTDNNIIPTCFGFTFQNGSSCIELQSGVLLNLQS